MPRIFWLAVLLLPSWPPAALAQERELLVRWPYFKEVQPRVEAGLVDVALDAGILGAARDDQGDIRIYSEDGREIPYALRILREEHTSQEFAPEEFNRGTVFRATQVYYDLGSAAAEHNEVEIDTAGNNFRRAVRVEGSRDGEIWATLARGELIFRFTSSAGSVDQRVVRYPDSRYRYLRITVERDGQVEAAPPAIEGVTVRKTVRISGERFRFAALFPVREATRDNGRPASAYSIDLNGRLPVSSVRMTVTDPVFQRPYRLEAIEADPLRPKHLLSGTLARRDEPAGGEVTLAFPETFATRFRLTVIDDRNPPLSIINVTAECALRQLIFEASEARGRPVRIYYGNRNAEPPNYDFAATVPLAPPEPPQRLMLGPRQENPHYEPEPQPLTERAPWAVYAVLSVAAAALLGILFNLAKAMDGKDRSSDSNTSSDT